LKSRHSREGGNPVGDGEPEVECFVSFWIPVFAGMTLKNQR
jgi:hypothetical protein